VGDHYLIALDPDRVAGAREQLGQELGCEAVAVELDVLELLRIDAGRRDRAGERARLFRTRWAW
jgi:hypothetical protein